MLLNLRAFVTSDLRSPANTNVLIVKINGIIFCIIEFLCHFYFIILLSLNTSFLGNFMTFDIKDVKILDKENLYEGYNSMQRLTLNVKYFNGDTSPDFQRECVLR